MNPLLLWIVSYLVSLAYQAYFAGQNFSRSLQFDCALLLSPVLGISIHYLLRQKIIRPIHLELGFISCGLSFIVLHIFRTPPALYPHLLSGRFGFSSEINPNHVAEIVDFSCPLAAGLALRETRHKRRIIYTSLFVLLVVLLFLTGTRGSLPGIILVAAYYLIASKYSLKFKAALVTLAMLLVPIIGASLFKRMSMKNLDDIISSITRVWLASSAYTMMKSRYFLFGFGMDQFASLKDSFGFPRWADPARKLSSHNFHLEIFLGWGMLGILTWFGLIFRLCFRLLRSNASAYAIPTALGIIAFVIHGFFDSLIAQEGFLTMVWVYLGYSTYIAESELGSLQPAGTQIQ